MLGAKPKIRPADIRHMRSRSSIRQMSGEYPTDEIFSSIRQLSGGLLCGCPPDIRIMGFASCSFCCPRPLAHNSIYIDGMSRVLTSKATLQIILSVCLFPKKTIILQNFPQKRQSCVVRREATSKEACRALFF